jgi:putative adhesin
VEPSLCQAARNFHQTVNVTPSEIVTLDVDLPNGELEICYGREGQVSVSAFAKTPETRRGDDNSSSPLVDVAQHGNHMIIRHAPSSDDADSPSRVSYRIDVPYRTEVTSKLETGRQSITGLLGPVLAVTKKGSITVAYVSKDVQARDETGNLDIQVIGGVVDAETSEGNVFCQRVSGGVRAKTRNGDITLTVVGPSSAAVDKGNGRIVVGGARGSLEASTDNGDLEIKATPRDAWNLRSISGNVHLELPPAASFELEASTETGKLDLDRDDVGPWDVKALQFHQNLNGGGKRVVVHTVSGAIILR